MKEPETTGREAPQVDLLEQLCHLIDEVDVLKGIIGRVPQPLLEGRPLPDDLSVKETYGVLATLDAEVRLPHVKQMVEEKNPSLEPANLRSLAEREDWNARPIQAILDQVQAARRDLVTYLETLAPEAWTRTGCLGEEEQTVLQLLYTAVQEDAASFRTLGYRLHESHMTIRPQNLPT